MVTGINVSVEVLSWRNVCFTIFVFLCVLLPSHLYLFVCLLGNNIRVKGKSFSKYPKVILCLSLSLSLSLSHSLSLSSSFSLSVSLSSYLSLHPLLSCPPLQRFCCICSCD